MPFVFIYAAVAYEYLLATIKMPRVAQGLVIALCAVNVVGIYNANWLSKVVPFKTQETVARNIVRDAQGRPFELHRVGPGDHFEGDFAQNYHYLLWYFGNEPVTAAPLKYTIYETKNNTVKVKKTLQ
ncbi:MAG: hypothetical protein UZ22_OP11002000475 [Microgenomates bacterium OLB23]|nr:MAG: hypothetical protein UZ22_OP11002000475 [Microgenomates bacterium OLB23]